MPTRNDKLQPITGEQVREVLKRLRTGKAKGADGWSPAELAAFPTSWTDRLAEFYTRWEEEGRWPQALRRSVIALMPKLGAESEAQLRPIGILSYIYRVWMVICKQDTKLWSLRTHGGAHTGAVALACSARAQTSRRC